MMQFWNILNVQRFKNLKAISEKLFEKLLSAAPIVTINVW